MSESDGVVRRRPQLFYLAPPSSPPPAAFMLDFAFPSSTFRTRDAKFSEHNVSSAFARTGERFTNMRVLMWEEGGIGGGVARREGKG